MLSAVRVGIKSNADISVNTPSIAQAKIVISITIYEIFAVELHATLTLAFRMIQGQI